MMETTSVPHKINRRARRLLPRVFFSSFKKARVRYQRPTFESFSLSLTAIYSMAPTKKKRKKFHRFYRCIYNSNCSRIYNFIYNIVHILIHLGDMSEWVEDAFFFSCPIDALTWRDRIRNFPVVIFNTYLSSATVDNFFV